jgi:aspartokinase-like uncharacterized kinase
VDAVVKVGGSLAEEPEQLIALCAKLSALAKNYGFVVVPGGGRFADVVRDSDERFNLSSGVSHRMAILGMDQFGMLLAQITPNSCATYSLEDARQLAETEAVPIFLPSCLLFKEDPLKNSWDVTSDSIAAYVAGRLQRTSVDLFLAGLLAEVHVDCYVVNGNFPDRVEAVLAGQQATCTVISAGTDGL